MNIITILDTSITSTNVGDQIIVDSVERELRDIFSENTFFNRVPTHEIIGRRSIRLIKESDYTFVAGTNLLTSNYRFLKSNLWNASLINALQFERVILMGVGWGNYQKNPNFLSKLFYKIALDSNYSHSVRDQYSKSMLTLAGNKKIINTACATMWQLSSENTKAISETKAKNVVTTITDYRKDFAKDKEMIQILLNNYENVYFWVQGINDLDYIQSIGLPVEIVGPTLQEYDNLLDSNIDVDYVGTRLHAGIRAIQKNKRSLIIGVDNRALEKKKDFNLNVLERKNISELENIINDSFVTDIRLNLNNINSWKKQFVIN